MTDSFIAVSPPNSPAASQKANQFSSLSDSFQAKGQKSLDSIYAESNGMWVCRRCETLNPNSVSSCVACGMWNNG